MSTLDVRGHDGYAKLDRKQPGTLFKCLQLTAARAGTFRIENQVAVRPLQKFLTHRQAPAERFVLCLAIDWNDVHESRNYEPRSRGGKEIIAGTEHRERRKGKPRSGHQDCAINMARMIAADDERGTGKLTLPGNSQRAITGEKRSAKSLKHGAARRWCQEHLFGFARVCHRTALSNAVAVIVLRRLKEHPTPLL
jgi:hypothetical protein